MNIAHDPTSLDPWQQQALDALNNGHHVIVDAPTSAGKTRIIEAFIKTHILNSEHFLPPLKTKDSPESFPKQVIYTCPVKSLSNDKFMEFCQEFGQDWVGINTGDFKENTGAPIILKTLETYRNS